MSLHPLRGHHAARQALAGARLRGTLPAALLIHGPPGVGKQRLALWAGQLLLCQAAGDEGPCGRCRSCRLALRLEHPDLHWYFPVVRPRGSYTPERLAEALEEARFAELSEIREHALRPTYTTEPRGFYLAAARTLRRRAQARPSMSTVQVFVIGDAENLVPQESSPEAANALLKLLEEPPASSRFILTSSEPGRLLPTIRSRTLHLHLPPLAGAEVEAFLTDVAEATPEDAARAARLGQGSIGRALGFLPDGDDAGPLEALRQDAFRLVRASLAPRPGDGFLLALGYRPAGSRGLLDLLGFVEAWIRDLAAVASGAPERVVNRDALDFLRRAAGDGRIDAPSVAAALEAVDQAGEQARGNVNPQLIVAGLVSALRGRFVPPPTDRPLAAADTAR